MANLFRDGGWGMYPTFLFGVLTLLASLRYALRPARRGVGLQVCLGLLTLVFGALGFVTGMIRTFHVAAGSGAPGLLAQPDLRWLWMVGAGEALNNVALALFALALAGLCATAGVLRGTEMRQNIAISRENMAES